MSVRVSNIGVPHVYREWLYHGWLLAEWECHIYREKGKLDSALQSTQPPRLQWCALSVSFHQVVAWYPFPRGPRASGNSRPDRWFPHVRKPQKGPESALGRQHHETYAIHVSTLSTAHDPESTPNNRSV